ncbi:MAG: glycosyltransferase [Solirubrobacterales bacterium]
MSVRIAIFSDYAYPAGGTEQFVLELIERAQVDHEVKLISWSDDVIVPADFSAVTTPEFGDIRQVWEVADWAEAILVVTSFNVRLLARFATDYLTERPKPSIAVVQTSAHSRESEARAVQEVWMRRLLGACRATVAVSTAVRDALTPIAPDPRKLHVIENAARITSRRSARPQTWSNVSFVGRPEPQKGFHHFLQLASEPGLRDITFRANTVSMPPRETSENVEFSWQLSENEMVEFFGQADLLVAPYTHGDGLPLALLEALACDVPVVGFDSPAVTPLLVRHGQSVIPQEYSALKDFVHGWTARREVSETKPGPLVHSWDDQYAQYEALLHRISGREGAPVTA